MPLRRKILLKLKAFSTLELESTTSSAIKISSSQDITTIESLLSDFVNSYNSVYSGISSLTTVPLSSDSSAGPLSGDSLARTIQRELRSFTTKSVEGYEDGPYSLSLLGVSTNRDGSISLNPNTLKNSFEGFSFTFYFYRRFARLIKYTPYSTSTVVSPIILFKCRIPRH